METKLELKDFIEIINSKSNHIFQKLERNLSKINIGRANPQLVSYLKVEYYDSLTPIGEIAAI
ncbi:ribosome recycling factor, partial [Vibrio harveyi]|nr:ribosome recycling factor [Vibrio harveyi]